jgi:hypothetical protein
MTKWQFILRQNITLYKWVQTIPNLIKYIWEAEVHAEWDLLKEALLSYKVTEKETKQTLAFPVCLIRDFGFGF